MQKINWQTTVIVIAALCAAAGIALPASAPTFTTLLISTGATAVFRRLLELAVGMGA